MFSYDRILEYIFLHPGATDNDLAQHFHLSYPYINQICNELASRRLLNRYQNRLHNGRHIIGNYPPDEWNVYLSQDSVSGMWTASSRYLPELKSLKNGSLDALMVEVKHAILEFKARNHLHIGTWEGIRYEFHHTEYLYW